ncbi:hypothetical protein [Micromonospora sp. NPDC002717]|uniref:hypothetical protein n=1 Tax=Micromonospora sp. NPDC002717 TaxID=3154424 RepID=UPI003330F79C
MNARLFRALAEGERHTPDTEVVLAEVRVGIARSARRRRYATVGLAAVATLGLTGTTVLIGGDEGFLSRPADSASPSGRATPVPPQECRLSLGWLPTGLSTPIRSCGPAAQSILYPMSGGAYLSVSIDQSGRQGTPTTRGWKPVAVNGRPGRTVTRATRSFVEFPLPSGRWASLEYGVGTPGGPAAKGLETTARRIAEQLTETPSGPLGAPFAPAYLPAGQRLAMVTHGGGLHFGVAYQDGSGRPHGAAEGITEDGVVTDLPTIDVGTTYRISWSADAANRFPLNPDERVGDVQGLPTYLTNQGRALVLEGFHGGQLVVSGSSPVPVRVSSPPDPAAVTPELVRIAQGVRWFG